MWAGEFTAHVKPYIPIVMDSIWKSLVNGYEVYDFLNFLSH